MEKEWIKENVRSRVWTNTAEFTKEYNKVFGTNVSTNAMNGYINRNGMQILSTQTNYSYTKEMDEWLINNYNESVSFVELAKEFNDRFFTNYSNCRIAKHCTRRLKIHNPKSKKEMINAGKFANGKKNCYHDLPVGTIRRNNDGRLFIKVKESDGYNCGTNNGHSYKEPYWKPLQKKIWEDNYGEVPEGYEVCCLTGNPDDTDPSHLYAIDRRLKARMAKNGWWTTEKHITLTGIKWCELDKQMREMEA